MNKKICAICKKEFEPIYSDHTLCHDCWDKRYNRRCAKCGCVINDLPSNYWYCNKCNTEIWHKK